MSNVDLEAIIEESLEDVFNEDINAGTTEVEPEAEPAVEASTPETPTPAVEATTTTPQVEGQAPPTQIEDDFSKRFGIPEKSVTGRENRIPYSRVRKIIEKNEKDLRDKLTKELEGTYKPKVTDYETKVRDYEDRLKQWNEFEQTVGTDPQKTLNILSTIPAYKPFFDYLDKLAAQVGGTNPAQSTPTKAPSPFVSDPTDPRPEPNQQMADGSRVYNMDGLQQLLDWNSRQTAKKVQAELDKSLAQRLGPIEEQRKQSEYLQTVVVPAVERQITEARTWPMFNEHEAAITEALQKDKTLSLEGAYRKVVVPKLMTDMNTTRTKILAEMKRQPGSTTVSTTRTTPKPTQHTGKRDLEDIIREEIAKIQA